MNTTDKSIILPEMNSFADFISLHMGATLGILMLLGFITFVTGVVIMCMSNKKSADNVSKLGSVTLLAGVTIFLVVPVFVMGLAPDKPYRVGEMLFGENVERNKQQEQLSWDIANAVYENSVTTFEYTDIERNQKIYFHVDGRALTITKNNDYAEEDSFDPKAGVVSEVLNEGRGRKVSE